MTLQSTLILSYSRTSANLTLLEELQLNRNLFTEREVEETGCFPRILSDISFSFFPTQSFLSFKIVSDVASQIH